MVLRQLESDSGSPSRATRPTLDPAPLAAWHAQTRDSAPTFVRELMDDFLKDAATHIVRMERAVVEQDVAACQFNAHRLQSSCSAIGASRLASLLEEMELLARHGAVTFLATQFAAIKEEYGRLEVALAQEQY